MLCKEMLRQGVLSTIITETANSVAADLYDWLKAATWKEFKIAIESGLEIGLPYEKPDGSLATVELGSVATEQQLLDWKQSLRNGFTREFTEKETMNILRHTLSADVLKDWMECLSVSAGGGHGVKFSVIGDEEGDIFVLKAHWVPGSMDEVPAKVMPGGFHVKGADASSNIADSTEITVSGISIILQREVRSAIEIGLKTTDGEFVHSIPSLTLHLPTSSSYKLNVIKSGVQYQARIAGVKEDLKKVTAVNYIIGFEKRLSGRSSPPVLIPLVECVADGDFDTQFAVHFKKERSPFVVARVNTLDGKQFTSSWKV